MNVKDLSILFKHVNFEDDKEVKNQMLQIIQQYLGKTETHNDSETPSEDISALSTINKTEEVTTEEVTTEEVTTEEVITEEKVVEPEVVQVQAEEVVIVPSAEPATIIESTQGVLPLEETVELEEQTSPIKKNITGVDDIEKALQAEEQKAEEVQENETESSPEDSVIVKEEASDVQVSQEDAEIEEIIDETTPDESKTYVENFSILATTDNEQLEQLKEEGGYIFREKRTFMLGLCVGNEWIALAKTQKFDEFPQDAQEHLKAGEFIAVKIKSVGEQVKKSRANFRDIEFYDFELLPTDHPVKIDVRNLIENGIVPEDKKEEIKEKSVQEEVKQTVETVVVQEPTPEVETIKQSIKLAKMFVNSFTATKDMALENTFPLSVKDGQGILKFDHPRGLLDIGECKTELPNGEYVVKFADYTMDGNIMSADMVIVSKEVKEVAAQAEVQQSVEVQESIHESTAEVEEVKAVEETAVSTRSELVRVSAKDAPADFPNKNMLTIELLPLAAEKLDRNALNKNDKPVNLLIKNNRVYLTYDIFMIGEAKETLSAETVADMKLMIRATQIDVIDTDDVTTLVYTFDQMVQADKYMSEKEVSPISEYLPLTEENFVIVQQKRAKNSLPKTPQEAMTPKDLQPGQVEKMTNPNGPVKDLGKSVEQLVPRKEVSESIKALQNKPYNEEVVSNVMNNAKSVLSTMVAEASSKTKVGLSSPEKQETIIQGTLKEGAGELTETETVVNFVTNYSKDSWERSVGKRMTLKSEILFNPGQDTSKSVTILGKDGSIVAKGQAPMTAAMFLDSDSHTAELLGIESAVALEKGFSVGLRLGNFEKVS